VNDCDAVALHLMAARLPAATATRVGWYAQPHPGAIAAVFWTVSGQDAAAISRPARMAGLGSIIDALVGRWDLALHGQHHADRAPICVIVRPRPDAITHVEAGDVATSRGRRPSQMPSTVIGGCEVAIRRAGCR
jgi:hypothetical protein